MILVWLDDRERRKLANSSQDMQACLQSLLSGCCGAPFVRDAHSLAWGAQLLCQDAAAA